MRIMLRCLLAVMAVLPAACLRSAAFQCTDAADCVRGGGQGVCESTGYCSFEDSTCPGGRRYGELSGPFANDCVAGTSGGDAGPDSGSPNDADGDGIANAEDNCPAVANADQGNEDNDADGDACDVCPIATSNVDGDGDGVGDACDPNPTTPGDAFVAFAGFAGSSLPAGWQAQGTWTVGGGVVGVVANNDSRLSLQTTATKLTVTASATVIDILGGLTSVGTIANHSPGTDNSIHCSVYRAPLGTSPGVGLILTPATNPQTQSYQMNEGATYTLTQRRDGASYNCRAETTGAQANVNGTYNQTFDPHAEGVMAFNAEARFQWVMIVRSP